MLKFFLKRLVSIIPTIFVVTVAVFMMVHLMPGDPAQIIAGDMATEEQIEMIRKHHGFNRPLHEQYISYMSRLLKGDFGTSTRTGVKINKELAVRLPNTLKLAGTASVFSLITGVLVGVLAAVKRNSIFDNICMLIALIGLSVPPFYLGLMLILIFSVTLGIFPISWNGSIMALVLPSISLGMRSSATTARMTRSNMLEVLSQDYITNARAQGFSECKLIFRHALKNSMNAIITVASTQFGALLAGAVITERVFAIPGLGDLIVTAIRARDFQVVQSGVLVVAIIFVFINLLVDLLYPIINPRIKIS